MTSFVVKENWGRGHRIDRLQKPNKKKGNFQRITLDFLPVEGEKTIHHEPPKFEGRGSVGVEVDHAGHAAIHWQRWKMFGDRRDLDAFAGQASLMDDGEADRLEDIRDSKEIMAKIEREIRRRRK